MNAADLLSSLAARGVEFQAHGDKLRFRPADRLSSAELDAVRRHKPELLELLRANPPAADNSPECSPAPLNTPRFRRCLTRCDRCDSLEFTDVSIHGGRSLRRDCSRCSRFMGWPRWYDEMFSSAN